jgi:hypothetical protein
MRTIDQLSQMPATDFLDTTKLISDYDALNSQYGIEQYNKGLEIGHSATEVHISIRNVWSARMKNGGIMQSYETLGYHSGTAALMRGFIDSGVTIVVWRQNTLDDGSYTVTDTVIQGVRVR